MLTGRLPWTKRNQQQLYEQIRKGEYVIPAYLSDGCHSFIHGLMTVDPARRLTIDGALWHPWMADVVHGDGDAPQPFTVSLRRVDLFFDREIYTDALDGADADGRNQSAELSPKLTARMLREGVRNTHPRNPIARPVIQRFVNPTDYAECIQTNCKIHHQSEYSE
jgi:serine/threonine protein kinase